MILEIHFQEGFSHDEVQLLVDGAVADQATLTTRLQTGLAAIRKLTVSPGAKVHIVLPGHGIKETVPADGAHRYVQVNFENGNLVTTPTNQIPGYL
ncbi:hypothetical protein [Dyadobacter beijingensis]|nr:hypothetical protein [Dyadobacter beijingensis]